MATLPSAHGGLQELAANRQVRGCHLPGASADLCGKRQAFVDRFSGLQGNFGGTLIGLFDLGRRRAGLSGLDDLLIRLDIFLAQIGESIAERVE